MDERAQKARKALLVSADAHNRDSSDRRSQKLIRKATYDLTGVSRGQDWPTNAEPRQVEGSDRVYMNACWSQSLNSTANKQLRKAVVEQVLDELKVGNLLAGLCASLNIMVSGQGRARPCSTGIGRSAFADGS
jgi:hypothetical protein